MAGLSDFRDEFLGPGDYVEARTSGSTGAPKTIRLSKSDMRRSARASNAAFGIGPDSLLACPLSADYIAGKMMVVRALEAGCRLVELPVSNTLELPGGRIDLLPVVPTQLASLLDLDNPAARVRTLLIGGGAPSANVCRRLEQAGVKAWISYGMTETCSHVALALAADPRRVFRAMPGISFAVTADSRLIVRAHGFDFGDQTTNDIVELLSGSEFRLLGRADNVINSGGLKLHPEQLEPIYAAVLGPEVDFYVAGEPDAELGSRVVLVAEAPADAAELLARLRASDIPHRLLPKRSVTVTALPRTRTGKLRRIVPEE